MKLPCLENAIVPEDKIIGYLLSPDHPTGRNKAAFFVACGFRHERWEQLADVLKSHGQTYPVIKSVSSAYVVRYVVEGELDTPSGRRLRIRTVWIVLNNSTVPRLVTAYPL